MQFPAGPTRLLEPSVVRRQDGHRGESVGVERLKLPESRKPMAFSKIYRDRLVLPSVSGEPSCVVETKGMQGQDRRAKGEGESPSHVARGAIEPKNDVDSCSQCGIVPYTFGIAVDNSPPNPFRALGLRRLASETGFRPGLFLVPALLAAVGAFFELLSGVLLIPALQAGILLRFEGLRESTVVSFFDDVLFGYQESDGKALFLGVLAVIVATSLLKTFLMHGAALVFSRLVHRVTGNLRRLLFMRCLRADKRFFDQANLGHVQNLLMGQIQKLAAQAVMAQEALSHFFLFLAYMTVMAWISWKLTVLVCALLPLIHAASSAMTTRVRAASHESALAQKALSTHIAGALGNSALVRTEASDRHEKNRLEAFALRADRIQAEIDIQSGLSPRVQESVFILMMVALLLGLASFSVPGQPSAIPSLLVFVYVARRASITAMSVARLKTSAAAVEGALQDALDLAEQSERFAQREGRVEFRGLNKALKVVNLTYRFGNGLPALTDLSLELPKGRTLAVVGPSGAGKSTFLNLILRHYDPPAATIFLDGTDIREFTTASLASQIAVVPQNPQFFDDTIRMNLSYPSPEPLPDERLLRALGEAGLLDFVESQPAGLDSLIGENGLRLSGGERQRLAIARAFLKGGDLLIFDEATSALDSETEAVIQRSLDAASKNRTAVIVAHRLSTVRKADNILVLDASRAVQTGTFAELADAPGLFRRLLQAQTFR